MDGEPLENSPAAPDLGEVDPEHLAIYEGVRAGTINPQKLSRMLDADGLLEGFLHIKGFERRLNKYLEKGVKGTLVAVDLDYFKMFNDSQGHPAGDDLLRLAGEILHKQTRTNAVGEEFREKRKSRREEFDLLARAGDEFVVFLVDADMDEAVQAARRIIAAIMKEAKETFPKYDRTQKMSIGLSQNKEGDTVRELRQRGDLALYEAKGGRGTEDIDTSIAIN